MAGWQTIDTAPKDGSTIICAIAGQKDWSLRAWKDNPRLLPTSGLSEANLAWLAARWKPYYWGDPVEMDDYDLALPENQPTHWLPTPPIPEAEPIVKRNSID